MHFYHSLTIMTGRGGDASIWDMLRFARRNIPLTTAP